MDYDGLDGILQLPETTSHAPKRHLTPWLTALAIIGLAGTFLLYKHNQTASTQTLSVQTDTTVTSPVSHYQPEQEISNAVPISPEPEIDAAAAESPNPIAATAITATESEQTLAPPETQAPADTASEVVFTVHFQFNSSNLNLLSKSERDNLIKAAKRCANIKLTGHTCNMGPAAINQRVGLARAESVKQLLSANGIPADRIVLASEGMDNPVVPNDTPIMAAQNRRVELTCGDR